MTRMRSTTSTTSPSDAVEAAPVRADYGGYVTEQPA